MLCLFKYKFGRPSMAMIFFFRQAVDWLAQSLYKQVYY